MTATITPTKITFMETKTHFMLVVSAPECVKGYTVIESTPIGSRKSIPSFKKHGAAYANRFAIPFIDHVADR